MNSAIPTIDGHDGIYFFPVRHYSPTSARLFVEMANEIDPVAVLIEGPFDYNESIEQLFLGHRFPIAIYSYVRYSDDSRQYAFYPFCEYSPEWQAAKWANDHKRTLEFIDLSWGRMYHETERAHRYSDANFQGNPYIEKLCDKMQVDQFDELWDLFFELDADLNWRSYLERCHHFCHHMRVFGGKETQENREREDFMTECIQCVRRTHDGPILVLTGGYHSSGLLARLRGEELEYLELENPLKINFPEDLKVGGLDEEEGESEPLQPPSIVENGITLTPFTYERIDTMSGYASGVRGPAFYEYVWNARNANQPLDCQAFLYDIVGRLRKAGQVASTADVIAIESTARALAALRGRSEIWRFDLLDAISTALVKEAQDDEYMHPMLMEARMAFRGNNRGSIAEGASLPPLVQSTYDILDKYDLMPGDQTRMVKLNLEKEEDRERSRVLHQAVNLKIDGFKYEHGTDFMLREDLAELEEVWAIRWSPEFEASLIEKAIYGSDLKQASAAMLLEDLRKDETTAESAGKIAISATLMGLEVLAEDVFEVISQLIAEDGDFFSVAAALGHIAFIDSYHDVFGRKATDPVEPLLEETYRRTIWLFEALGNIGDQMKQLVESVRTLHITFTKKYRSNPAHYADYTGVFSRIANDRDQSPVTRGCATGGLFSLGEVDTESVLKTIQSFSDPVELGDFLVGLFSLAREAAQQDARLMELLDKLIKQLDDKAFLEMLPGLRLAFTFFTPLEKHQLIDMLFHKAADDVGIPDIDERALTKSQRLAFRMAATAKMFGLRGGDEVEIPSVPKPNHSEAENTQPQPSESGQDATHGEPGEAAEPGEAGECEGDGSATGQGQGQGQAGMVAGGANAAMGGGSSAPTLNADDPAEARKIRWQLIMGVGAEGALGGLAGQAMQINRLLGFLYDREYGAGKNVRGGDRKGGLEESQMAVPEWINGIHELFPKRTIERLEKDAIDRYDLEEIVTRPDVLRRAEPNMTLLKAVLRTKHLMNAEVLELARGLVRKVVQELMEQLAQEINTPFSGARDRRRRSNLRVHANFDALQTIRRNLKNFDPERGKLIVRDPFFYSRVKRHVEKWQILVVVDQSGSMVDSVIHSAITASIFKSIKSIRSHLIAFDTNIVDLSNEVDDPVETLMKVQLGGGTDIANALEYANSLVEVPRKTICVLITDFYEGGPVGHLLAVTKQMVESGVTLLGLAALDSQANPIYDKVTAGKMAQLGAEVGAMTPGELAEWIAERVK